MKNRSEIRRDRATILRQRALGHARVPEAGSTAADFLEVVEFSLAGERYAIEIGCVSEVLLFSNCTPLPCAPAFVAGLVNVRGRILHVIQLGGFFDLPLRGIVDLHHILIVHYGAVELGILADLVTGLRRVRRGDLQSSLPTLTGIRAEYLKGVTADRLVVLDVARILADRRQIVHEEVEP